MGVFSKHHRFRKAGQDANQYNVEMYGVPARSLFTSTKVFTLHHKIEITNEQEEVVYRAQSKFFTLHDKTDVTDAAGKQVAHIERKILTLHQRHFVTMADGTRFELSSELFHIVKDVINIEGLGWQLRGNVFGWNFQLFDAEGGIIALISQKAISLHDKYCIDIFRPEYEGIVVAILVTLQHMIRDRERSSSSSSFSSSASN